MLKYQPVQLPERLPKFGLFIPMHRPYPPANYLNAPLKRQQTKAVAGRKLKKTEERSRRNDEARAAKQRQMQRDSRDRRAQQEANDRADQERRDQERRHRETLSAIIYTQLTEVFSRCD